MENTTLTLDDCIHAIATDSRLTPNKPGVTAQYSDTSFQLLAKVVERLTGLSWEAAFQKYIGGPLKMSSSTYICVDPRFSQVSPSNAAKPLVANGLCSTANDFAKFTEWLYHRINTYAIGAPALPELVSLHGIREMLTTQVVGPIENELPKELAFDKGKVLCKNTNQAVDLQDLAKGDVPTSMYGYGFGLEISLGVRTKLFTHPSTLSEYTVFAPGRYAIHFSTLYQNALQTVEFMKALEVLEKANPVTVRMQGVAYDLGICPTGIEPRSGS